MTNERRRRKVSTDFLLHQLQNTSLERKKKVQLSIDSFLIALQPPQSEPLIVQSTESEPSRHSFDTAITAVMRDLVETAASFKRKVVCSSPALAPLAEPGGKKTLVLDLDETLVHCTTSSASPDDQKPASLGHDFAFAVSFRGEQIQVFCKMRPGLLGFLRDASQHFRVVVFTASQKIYADALLDVLDPDRTIFSARLFRDSCTVAPNGSLLKDLKMVGAPLSEVVIVDNAPQSFILHLENGIPIVSWYDNEGDEELAHLLRLLKRLDVHGGDVREFIKGEFEWFCTTGGFGDGS